MATVHEQIGSHEQGQDSWCTVVQSRTKTVQVVNKVPSGAPYKHHSKGIYQAGEVFCGYLLPTRFSRHTFAT